MVGRLRCAPEYGKMSTSRERRSVTYMRIEVEPLFALRARASAPLQQRSSAFEPSAWRRGLPRRHAMAMRGVPFDEREVGKMSTSRGQRSVTYTRIEIDPLGEAVGSGLRVWSQRGLISILDSGAIRGW